MAINKDEILKRLDGLENGDYYQSKVMVLKECSLCEYLIYDCGSCNEIFVKGEEIYCHKDDEEAKHICEKCKRILEVK